MRSLLKPTLCALFVVCLSSTFSISAIAQQETNEKETVAPTSNTANLRAPEPPNAKKSDGLSVDEKLQRMEKLIELQQQEIKELRSLVERIAAQDKNAAQIPTPDTNVDPATVQTVASTETLGSLQTATTVDKKPEQSWAERIRTSGDIRFRFETFRNQGFDSPVEVPSRNRMRVRARLELKTDECRNKGIVGPCFDFGLKLASGNFTDNISTNQTLTDFYERKPFALERAFVKLTWRSNTNNSNSDKAASLTSTATPTASPSPSPEPRWKFELTAGKFEPTFRRAQMVWDDDVNVEGLSEALSFTPKNQKLPGVTMVAFQLPFGEVPAGKDGMLYGGQLQTDWKVGKNSRADINLGYYSWNHAEQVLFALGAAATQVNGGISNSAAVTGGQNGDLGTTNRIIRNPITGNPIGFVANFNLFDVLGNYVWQITYPEKGQKTYVKFTFDYVRNLSRRINNENNGYWGGIEFRGTSCVWRKGRWYENKEEEKNKDNKNLKENNTDAKEDNTCDDLKKQGDWLLGYTFTRIQQDAVLVPFNFSDILASNSRAHMPTVAYVPRDRIVLQWTGLFSQRANKIFPLSPVNRWLNRMQFDVIYKF